MNTSYNHGFLIFRNTAILDSRYFLEHAMIEHSDNADGFSNFYITREGAYVALLACTMPHGAPYADQFNRLTGIALQVSTLN